MLPPLAGLDALCERLGILSDAGTTEGARASAALEDASNHVRAEAGKDWVDEDGDLDDVPSIVETITMAVAIRAYRNPDGVSQKSLGDVSVSFAREGGADAVYLTQAERRAVRRAAGRSVASSVALETGITLAPSSANLYAPVAGGGDPIPLGPVPWEA